MTEYVYKFSPATLLSLPHTPPLPVLTLSLTLQMDPSMPDSKIAQRLILNHNSLDCDTPICRIHLYRRKQQTSPMPTCLALGHFPRTTNRPDMTTH